MANKKIGFIGVGLMGHGMAKNLVAKGFETTVLGHKNRAPVEDLVKHGAKSFAVRFTAGVCIVQSVVLVLRMVTTLLDPRSGTRASPPWKSPPEASPAARWSCAAGP